MLLDVLQCGVVQQDPLHGQQILKEEDPIGLDLYLKIMPNMDMVNLQQEKLEDKNYIMMLKMLVIFLNFPNNSKKMYNFGSITGKMLINVIPFMKLACRDLKIYKELKYIKITHP